MNPKRLIWYDILKSLNSSIFLNLDLCYQYYFYIYKKAT